jgi:hypothetical protein
MMKTITTTINQKDCDMETQKFQKKPLIVEAIQVDEGNFLEVANWSQGTIRNVDGSEVFTELTDDPMPSSGRYIHVRVLNPMHDRQTKAFVGDWVLYAGRGFKVYKDRAFKGTFLPLEGTARDEAAQASKEDPSELAQAVAKVKRMDEEQQFLN